MTITRILFLGRRMSSQIGSMAPKKWSPKMEEKTLQKE